MNLDVPLAGACRRRTEEEETKQSHGQKYSVPTASYRHW